MSDKEIAVFEQVRTYLQKYDEISHSQLQKLEGLSEASASCYLAKFVKIDLLTQSSTNRNHRYHLN
ncbi:hypothetical protein AB6M97_08615 [Streptococcus hillyeri]|uniref:Uncharacterized protein n=1 Tax=Streptococcus hillyeri TaxID=2282420 RepID=A0A3L9DQP1_9STRE|nr:hypothetical protein [Streptococcus hillyeri]RLY03235.1 hypothetical protein EAF07_05505 [Streptococcus hillyeri]